MNKIFIWALFFVLCLFCRVQARNVEISSPDGRLKVRICLNKSIVYNVLSDKNIVLRDCLLGMTLADRTLGENNPKLKHTSRGVVNESIRREIPLNNAIIKNSYNWLYLNFAGDYAVEFRVYDNGIAYRFLLSKKDSVSVMDEKFYIGLPSDCQMISAQTNSFKTSYENPYVHINTANYKPSDAMCYLPVLLETDKGYKILVSETDLHDYPCMFLRGTDSNGLQSIFPKCPIVFGYDGDRSVKIEREADYIARTAGTRSFPWRFMTITKDDRRIVDNEMEFNLASPCKLKDCSWIKPGQASWDWWNHRRLYGVDFRAGVNDDTYKYYIDFASKYHIPYIVIDEGWAKDTRDPYHSISAIHLQSLIAYGSQRNVKIILWLPWLTVENHFSLFKTYANWGIAGIKIDFMDRSDQWMVDFYERVAKEAAANHLIVDFHGAFKPAGLERCYPNVLSYEGVRGMEQGRGCEPRNSIYLPFIRNAVGPMDFTPGSMLSAQPEDNYSTSSNAMGSGTRAYQMALYVVFESGLQMLADNPVLYYRENECTGFITSVPVTWDDTKILSAKVGSYIVVAKRKGGRWFIGAITGDAPQQFDIQLNFLDANHKYHLTYFKDGINADQQAMDYKKGEGDVNNSTYIRMNLVRNGGWCGVIE